ncbi:MAG: aminotransferase class I/II-fold pyridoxal phosphate-dependent enzyme [Clostridia bacterium]|nr:aminotransferase class I/II-fold pyridoxal phosphate-dependent enzyme [Clostridia bacterium]
MKSLFDKLTAYADRHRISFAMPGHKGGRGLSEEFKSNIARIDVTELADTENLHAPKCELAEASKALAERFGAKESFFLTGGSTEGVHIMLFCAVRGGKLLTNRTCHRSVINAAVIAGFGVEFLRQEQDTGIMTPKPPTAEEVERALRESGDIAACIITSPDYYGHIADIEGIADVCHRAGIPLLVDEAHGAQLSADGMCGGAILHGADMAVQSAHKTLNALNQAAFLHFNSTLIDGASVRAMTAMVGTSSPSYPIVASAQLALDGLTGSDWCDLCDYLDKKRTSLKERTKIVYPEGEVDRARVVFGLSGYELSGYEAEQILRERYNIDVEMSDRYNVVCIVTPTNTREEIDLLFRAAEEIVRDVGYRNEPTYPEPPRPKTVMTPREAFWSKGENVGLTDAVGRVSRANVSAYPPGIAIIAAGEEITEEIADYILKIEALGAEIEGMTDGKISVSAK